MLSQFYNDVDKWSLEKIVETMSAMDFIDEITKGKERVLRLKKKET